MAAAKESRRLLAPLLCLAAAFFLVVLSLVDWQHRFSLDRIRLSLPSHFIGLSSSPSPSLRRYDLTITRGRAAPDGVDRPVLLINGRFSGPLIEARAGDTLHITVRNRLDPNTTAWDGEYRKLFSTQVEKILPPGVESNVALHWHGLSMRGYTHMDGAPGFSGEPIAPGSDGVYVFTVSDEDVGTHWYHSHVGMQRSDGLYGALVIRPSLSSSASPSNGGAGLTWEHEEVVTLGDHYHTPGIDQLAWFVSRHSLGFEPTPDSILINGRGNANCSKILDATVRARCNPRGGAHAEITIPHGKTTRLRIINVGAVGHQTFSVDGHSMTVIEADGTPIKPFHTRRLSIATGQRYSVLLSVLPSHSHTSSFWMRSSMDAECFNLPNPSLDYAARAILRYTRPQGIDLRARGWALDLPSTEEAWGSGEADDDVTPCHDMPMYLLAPLDAERLSLPERAEISTKVTLTMPKTDRNGLVPISYVNRTTWSHHTGSPSLLTRFKQANVSALAQPVYPHDPYTPLPSSSGLPFDPRTQMVIHASSALAADSWIDLVIENRDEAPHPFHLHGHKFLVLESSESEVGWGGYHPTTAPSSAGDDATPWRSLRGVVVRDTFSIPRRGWSRIVWKMDNPGVWPLHCHVLVHMATGMSLAVAERVDLLASSGKGGAPM